MGFLAGVVGELNRREDKAERREEFMMNLLERRKDSILPEIKERISKRNAKVSERKARVDMAVSNFQFSERSAKALELTGQLEYQLANLVQLGDKLDPTYVANLTAGLEDRIDNDEDLAAAISAGLSGPLDTEEDKSQAFIRAYQATDAASFDKELNDLVSYSGGSLPSYDKPFKITAGKGSQVSGSDANTIRKQINEALAVMYRDKFQQNENGEYGLKPDVEGGAEVNFLFNEMVNKATELAQDPFNNFSTVGATQFIVQKLQPALDINATTVADNLNSALTDDTFNWDRFR
ncbi:MAG: hypothetical protein CMJ25_30805 [Phycisphaerae bacterium]|nr:hypothetical protein [Phycisphaerae bacterium]|tara:strand:+ start:2083 stop:2961 length:879 start_codon:yes stop_codon:yes gene_type:complete